MGILEDIKQKLDKIRSDEGTLEQEIESGESGALEDSEHVLNEIEELDQDFVDLLLSDNAQDTINRAVNIIEWEKDVSKFFETLSADITDVKQAIVNQDHREFNEAVNKIRSDIKELRSRREAIELNQETEEAIDLLSNFENIEKEIEWFEDAVRTLEKQEKLLESTEEADELQLEREEIQKIEQTIPGLESQIKKLAELVQEHEEIGLEPEDFEFDIDSELLKSFSPEEQREKAELEYLMSLIEELKKLAGSKKGSSSRRDYLKMVAEASTIVTGSFFAKEATESYSKPDILDSEPGKWKRQNKLNLEGLNVAYVVKGDGNQAEMIIEFKNTGNQILDVEAAVEIPESWKEQSQDMVFQEASEISD